MWIFLALIVVPIIEIALFIKVGGFLGLWPTIAVVIGTAVLGGILLRAQGFEAMRRLQASLEAGGDPRGPMAHGAMILVAGLLMLTPGFFTDAVGFLLLIPPVRQALIAWIGPRLAARTVVMGAHYERRTRRPDDGSIEAEYVDVTDGPKRPGGSGWSRPPK
jgi:UPF0716 protein FxsA